MSIGELRGEYSSVQQLLTQAETRGYSWKQLHDDDPERQGSIQQDLRDLGTRLSALELELAQRRSRPSAARAALTAESLVPKETVISKARQRPLVRVGAHAGLSNNVNRREPT